MLKKAGMACQLHHLSEPVLSTKTKMVLMMALPSRFYKMAVFLKAKTITWAAWAWLMQNFLGLTLQVALQSQSNVEGLTLDRRWMCWRVRILRRARIIIKRRSIMHQRLMNPFPLKIYSTSESLPPKHLQYHLFNRHWCRDQRLRIKMACGSTRGTSRIPTIT